MYSLLFYLILLLSEGINVTDKEYTEGLIRDGIEFKAQKKQLRTTILVAFAFLLFMGIFFMVFFTINKWFDNIDIISYGVFGGLIIIDVKYQS